MSLTRRDRDDKQFYQYNEWQQEKYEVRLLKLCWGRVLQTGEFSYPPFVRIITRYKTAGGKYWKHRPDVKILYYLERVKTLGHTSFESATSAQRVLAKGVSQIIHIEQVSSLVINAAEQAELLYKTAKEVQELLHQLDVVAPLKIKNLHQTQRKICFASEYLQEKFALQEITQNSDLPRIDRSPLVRRRCYRYLEDLKEGSHELSSAMRDKLLEAGIALGILNV